MRMITNKEIGKIARKVGSVDTKSYSEVRGGRRVKKYRMSFGLKYDAMKFMDLMKERDLPIPYVRGYSYHSFGYVVEYTREEVATKKELKREEELKDLRRMPKNPTWRNKCLCIFKPQYEVKNRPDSVIIQDEEVAEIAEYLLDEIEINLKVTLEVNSAFMMQWDVPNIRDQFLLLREVLEEKIIRTDDWMSQNLADHFYGAKKNYKKQ